MIDYGNGLASWWSDVADYFNEALTSIWGVFSIILLLFGLFFFILFVILIVRFFRSGESGGTKEK